MNNLAGRTIAALLESLHHRPTWSPDWQCESKHRSAKTGKHGGPKVDRFKKRKRKMAEASRKKNRLA